MHGNILLRFPAIKFVYSSIVVVTLFIGDLGTFFLIHSRIWTRYFHWWSYYRISANKQQLNSRHLTSLYLILLWWILESRCFVKLLKWYYFWEIKSFLSHEIVYIERWCIENTYQFSSIFSISIVSYAKNTAGRFVPS